MKDNDSPREPAPLRPIPKLIFASRWLQLPLYLGLIAAQGVYVFHFLVELLHIFIPIGFCQDACRSNSCINAITLYDAMVLYSIIRLETVSVYKKVFRYDG